MCGRYVRRTPLQNVIDLFSALPEEGGSLNDSPRYNIAPTQDVVAVRLDRQGQRRLANLRWGLIPAWAQDAAIGNRMINARAETVAEKPAYRAAFRTRRCLLPADGFYEWKADGKRKQPFFIHRADSAPFGFAGLWERWEKGESPVQSCCVLTTEPNTLMKGIHNRMPVILRPEDYARWLDPRTPAAELEKLMVPLSGEDLEAYPVDTRVNNPRNEGEECMKRAEQNLF